MNLKFLKTISFLLLIATLVVSCVPNKKIFYLQGTLKDTITASNYEHVFQPADQLLIVITAENPEVAIPYNLNSITVDTNTKKEMTSNGPVQTYIVSNDGTIDMPILGIVKMAGLTRLEGIQKIKELLVNHIKDPMVTLKLVNFQISVLGEVKTPGTQIIQNERVTILEALSAAGDLTQYGLRESIKIIRENNGVKTINTIDLTSSDLLHSPFYYLAQNDVIYVEPSRTFVNSTAIGPNIAFYLSTVSLIMTIAILITNIK